MFASRFTLALAVIALPWGAPAAAAQDAGRFRGMDTNRDGVITRSEWRGSTQSFRTHDWNNDGVLSGDELRPGAVRDSRWDEEDYDPERPGQITDWTARGFRALDHNRDGRITRNEWHDDLEIFRRVDRDDNNSISRAEYLGGADADRSDRFDYLDIDNDGRVEWDEWHGSQAEFDRLDRNRDRVLTRREMTGSDTAPGETDRFASLDWNRNGTISVDEWHWSRVSFEQRDLNRDGVLTRREFDATAGLGNSGTDVSRASGEVREVSVDSRQRWTPTGLFVQEGDLVSWQASGTITMSSGSDTATPSGSTTGRRAANAPLRDQSAGGLLMRIGDSVVRFAGASGSFRATTSGEIALGVNDDHLADNSGEYRVRVTIGR